MNEPFAEKLRSLFRDIWQLDGIIIRPVEGDYDLWYAVVECKLYPEQWNYVSPAGFALGRAYLNPDDNVPCVITKADGERTGFIVLKKWMTDEQIQTPGYTWSYFVDVREQGKGYGKAAAKLAVKILNEADPMMPIKLAVHPDNEKARRLYISLGFQKSEEMDGDDAVYVLL